MINAISLGHKETLITLGVLAVILMIISPKLLSSVIRFVILIVVAGLLMVLRNVIDPYELLAGLFLSQVSGFYELLGGIEAIAIDSIILFVCARFILPKSAFCQLILVIGGALYCLWNLMHYNTFTFMPWGYDPDAPGEINWTFNIVYMAVYALCAWMFSLNTEDEVPEIA